LGTLPASDSAAFPIIATRFGVGGAAEVFRISPIDEAALDPHSAHGVGEEIPSATIDVGRADEIIACVTDILACPDATASAPTPPSSAATRSSSTACVGFMMRV
jgi:hypothetical protein